MRTIVLTSIHAIPSYAGGTYTSELAHAVGAAVTLGVTLALVWLFVSTTFQVAKHHVESRRLVIILTVAVLTTIVTVGALNR